MQQVRWLGFCASQALSRSVAHFFPSSESASAPYSASCKLSLFGNDLPANTVVLDGARIGHPDGVRLDDAFPILRQQQVGGLFGLEVEVSTPQPRLDVDVSECVVEILFQGLPVRFMPKRTLGRARPERETGAVDSGGVNAVVANSDQHRGNNRQFPFLGTALAVKDSSNVTSFIVVNRRPEPISVTAVFDASEREGTGAVIGEASFEACGRCEVPPRSVREFPIDERAFAAASAIETSWGPFQGVSVGLTFTDNRRPTTVSSGDGTFGDEQDDVAAFVAYRDPTTRRIVSVIGVSS